MHVLVPLRRSVDARAMVRIAPDGKSLAIQGLKTALNLFDETALECALQAREKNKIQRITAITMGDDTAKDLLFHALAMGADNAVHIQCNAPVAPITTMQAIAVFVRQNAVDAVFLGKENPDDGYGTEAAMLTALLQETACKIDVVDLTQTTPRRVLLPQIIAAKSKPIAVRMLDEFDVEPVKPAHIVALDYPPQRAQAVMLGDLDALCRVIDKAIA